MPIPVRTESDWDASLCILVSVLTSFAAPQTGGLRVKLHAHSAGTLIRAKSPKHLLCSEVLITFASSTRADESSGLRPVLNMSHSKCRTLHTSKHISKYSTMICCPPFKPPAIPCQGAQGHLELGDLHLPKRVAIRWLFEAGYPLWLAFNGQPKGHQTFFGVTYKKRGMEVDAVVDIISWGIYKLSWPYCGWTNPAPPKKP